MEEGLREESFVHLRGARQNNLQGLDWDLPLGKLTVVTGVSGSGKSSLVLETLHGESQRRYFLSLSTFARQYFERIAPPLFDRLDSLPPSIAIERRSTARNPRSTVATLTEIYDFLRVLFARIGVPRCPLCGRDFRSHTQATLAEEIEAKWGGERVSLGFQTSESAEKMHGAGFLYGWKGSERVTLFELRGAKPLEISLDSLVPKEENRQRLYETLKTAFQWGEKVLLLDPQGEKHLFHSRYGCPHCGTTFQKPQPQLFSFNSSRGACPTCKGLGDLRQLDWDKILPDPSLSLEEGVVEPFTKPSMEEFQEELLRFCRTEGISTKRPFETLSPEEKRIIVEGKGESYAGVAGVFSLFESYTYKPMVRIFLSKYSSYSLCRECGGGRLNQEAMAYRIDGLTIAQWNGLTVDAFHQKLTAVLHGLERDFASRKVIAELLERLRYLHEVGLDYLTLDRPTHTLSGGEAQRISLTSVLGSTLTDTLIVVDEPSTGLHPKDFSNLLKTMAKLRDSGNTVVLIEHLHEAFQVADRVLELGPGAGPEGGRALFWGEASRYVPPPVPVVPSPARIGNERLTVEGAKKFNLKGFNVSFPLGSLSAITGLSGAGKSTLLYEVIYKGLTGEETNFRSLKGFQGLTPVYIDDAPPVRTPRATLATYLKIIDPIRQFMATLPESKAKKLTPGHFSYNRPEGACPLCRGEGFETVEMQFLSDLHLVCEGCRGRRYNDEILQVLFKGKSMADILEMTCREAADLFRLEVPSLKRRVSWLSELGIDYLKVGQTLNSLSGGESQRVKIARHFLEGEVKDTLFLIDEPTSGLHPKDIAREVEAFQRLLREGATIIVVEHNPLFLLHCHHIVDLGPGGGERGGELLFQGSVEELMAKPSTATALALRKEGERGGVVKKRTIKGDGAVRGSRKRT